MNDQQLNQILSMTEGKADAVEVLYERGESFSVKIFKQEIDSFKYAESGGVGIRLLKDGRTGTAFSEDLSEDSLAQMVDDALIAAKYSENDDKVIIKNHLAPAKLGQLSLPDSLEVAEKVELAKKIDQIATNADARIFSVPYASVGNGSGYRRLVNSAGLDRSEEVSYAHAVTQILAEENGEKKGSFNFWIDRNFTTVNAEKLVGKAVEDTMILFGGQSITSGKYPVLLRNRVMASILGAFSSIFSAKSVKEGRSLLKGKIGETIGASNVKLIDDALNIDGLSARSFDSEGTPSQTISLIENGELKTYLHNSVTAEEFGVASTGHGSRSFKGSLGVAPSNFYLEKGAESPDALRAKSNKVIEVVSVQGLHAGTNAVSGDFSLQAEGLLYENGQLISALKPFTISGNFVDLLKQIIGIGDDFEFNTSNIGSAAVLVDGLTVSA